ncbi:uncharacterized protein LOC128856436 [Anastrepha ludens]|uniref:uncharacterized protein LOC128856436 n=1 Tax=Anastrepha ludens TaxID=28586 RepID=UPI0023B1998F|nr:uncharacterized protein LOC128856436 [Anastrepha ludens]
MNDPEETIEKRRSPRLNKLEPESGEVQPNSTAIIIDAASAATTHANATTAASTYTNVTNTALSSESVSLRLEMKNQIATLQRQLEEAQVRLSEQNRHCQRLEIALRSSGHLDSATSTATTTTIPVVASSLAPAIGAPLYEFPNFSCTSRMQKLSVNATTNNITPSTINSYAHFATSTITSSAAMLPGQQAAENGGSFFSLPSLTASAVFAPTYSIKGQTHATLGNSGVPFTSSSIISPPVFNNYNSIVHGPMPTNDLNNFSFLNNSATVPRKLQDLPEFSGEPEDWPIFYTAYVQSTSMYNYTNLENNQRLQKAVKGEAREVIKSLLIHPDNASAAIEQLRFRFGRPEQLIQSQLRQARDLPNISENALSKLVPFATKVRNLATFLQSANGQQHIANPTLLEELLAKLPMSKKLEWARVAASIQPYPTIVHFSAWVSELANLICTVQDIDNKDQKRRAVLHTSEKQCPGYAGVTPVKCPLCQEQHKLQDCRRFLNAAVSNRWEFAKKHRACFSYLNVGHNTRNCRRKKFCLEEGCQRRHHSLLHEANAITPTLSLLKEEQGDVRGNVLSCTNVSSNKPKLLFRVLPVTLYGDNKRIDTYALLDEGSSITMLDSDLAKELGIRGRRHSLDIQWFGGRTAQESTEVFNIEISGVGKNKRYLLRDVYAVANLGLPMQSLSHDDLKSSDKSISSLPLQPYFDAVPQLLIGIDHAHLGLPIDIKGISEQGPYACNTKLGWVVFGPTSRASLATRSCLFLRTQEMQEEEDMRQLVFDYFNIESLGVRSSPPVESNDDVRAKMLLEGTTKRVGGRFQTGLLWKDDSIQLPDNYTAALHRLEGIERKMKRDETFATAYKEIIDGYLSKGYARKLTPKKSSMTSSRKWYLPHFGVVNPNKPQKLRLVFDAASRFEGVSLNSKLLKGPQLYISLPSILFNFRTRAVAVCGDIKEMFHQVAIQPVDRCAQRFLWRDGENTKPPEEYEMRVMIFGAACSPCSAQYVMRLNAKEHHESHPRAIKAIFDHHYIDDFVDSFDGIEEAVDISKQVRDIHSDGGFELRGFVSNSEKVVKELNGSTATKQIAVAESTEKVLGLYWESATDNFKFNLKFHRIEQAVITGERSPTKRELLSIIMSIFDPLGFLSHFTVAAKSLMREVWCRDVRWDEPIPNDVNIIWERWRQQMHKVAGFRVPRFYFPHGAPSDLELHVFVDASEEAFAAVAYWRSRKSTGEVGVTLVCAKTKCAPLKAVTIPRLELQAAVLGVRLRKLILENHQIRPERCFLWSDSRTILKWIGSEHRCYKPYVAHRVAEILDGSEVREWRWVPTKDNAADDATRSHGSVDFSLKSRWLQGPNFLRRDEETWPAEENISKIFVEADEELHYNRFSNLLKLKRAVAWVLRFINRCRKRELKHLEYGLTAVELEAAEHLLCLRVQSESFTSERNSIEIGKAIPNDSALKQLSPYLDDRGLLRVQGRIDAASFLPYNIRRPIILPYGHIFTHLVVNYHHCTMKHQNHEATISNIRQKYWIPRIRQMLRRVIAGCKYCQVRKTEPHAPMMGPLPEDRLKPYVRPFTYTGLDYFGPISVTIGRRTEKRWVALFTCLTVRAIHLEIAHDLSTDSCIIVMRNFMNRRGVPTRLRSDNGKNFIGANEEAKRFPDVFDTERIQNELSTKGVEWFFNCPANPSEGGIRERMVQSVKRVLRHSLKEKAPREHVLQSFLIEAENIVNSRPLTHLPISPDEDEPLTPNHFLIGVGNIPKTPTANSPGEKIPLLRKQWLIARSLRDAFWKRWVLEYLPTLTRRVKWCERTAPLKEGDVVFICDPNVPRIQWRRGIVERVYTGADGVARRADVRTVGGLLQRAVSKLAVLDLGSGEAGRSTGVGVLTNDI